MEDCARAALDVLDAADVQRAALLGLSWGGFVALRVAIAEPDRVAGLVLSNSSAQRGSALARGRDRVAATLLRMGVLPSPGRLVASGMLSSHSRQTNPQLVADVAEAVNRMDPRSLATAMRSVLVDRTAVVNLLPTIEAPTLIITGAEDTALPNTHSKAMATAIRGSRFEVLPDVGHLAPREATDAVGVLLRDFLGSLPG
jgi:3-oxoadipate enol-lactonase